MNTPNPARDYILGDFTQHSPSQVGWQIEDKLVPYLSAVEAMENQVGGIISGELAEKIWLLEHPALYTGGTSAEDHDLIDKDRFPIFMAGRGGEFTYHGPGQRICYVMLDLANRKRDVRQYVATLEQWIINTLEHYSVKGERRCDRVGVWVKRPDKAPLPDGTPREDKVAAIGVRIRKWVTFHGVSLNVEPELEHYSGIIPCGVEGHGVTSLVDLGVPVTMAEVDSVLKAEFEKLFGTLGSV